MKTIFTAIVFLIAISATSQIQKIETPKRIEVGKVAPMGSFKASIEKSGDEYTINYRDINYVQNVVMKSVSFKETGSDLQTLYQTIIDGIDKQSEDVLLQLPGGVLNLRFGKQMGTGFVQFFHTNEAGVEGQSDMMNKKQIGKLFGKVK